MEWGLRWSPISPHIQARRWRTNWSTEAALGVDAAPLLAMQNEYDMLTAERNESFMEKLKKIRRIAAVF